MIRNRTDGGNSEQPSLFKKKHWQDHDLIRDELCPPGKSKAKLLLWILVSRMGERRQTWDAKVAELAHACNCGVSTLREVMTTLKSEELLTYEPIAGKPTTRAFDAFLRCYEKGVLIRTTADIIALSPPLIIEKRQIDQLFETIAGVLKELP